MIRQFTFAEWQSIAFDLRTAAEVYRQDSVSSARDDNPRLSDQFHRQAVASEKLALYIEEHAE